MRVGLSRYSGRLYDMVAWQEDLDWTRFDFDEEVRKSTTWVSFTHLN